MSAVQGFIMYKDLWRNDRDFPLYRGCLPLRGVRYAGSHCTCTLASPGAVLTLGRGTGLPPATLRVCTLLCSSSRQRSTTFRASDDPSPERPGTVWQLYPHRTVVHSKVLTYYSVIVLRSPGNTCDDNMCSM